MIHKRFLSAVLLGTTTNTRAFSPTPPPHSAKILHSLNSDVPTVALRGTVRPDATDAIADALEMVEKFGATSNEARVAWDIVEEMDSNDSSTAYKNSNTDPMTNTQDYYFNIQSLSYLLEESRFTLYQMKQLVSKIKDLELADPTLSRLTDDTATGSAGSVEALKAALSNAKAMAEVHGPSSAEANAAWDKLDTCFGGSADGVLEVSEECDLEASPVRYSAAALKAHHYYNAVIDASLLQETLDALGVLKGLEKYVNIEKRRLDAREQ